METGRVERTHNLRGFLKIGPQCVNPSDVLAQLIAAAMLALADQHYAPDPREARRAMGINRGRVAAARAGRRVRPWECVA